MSAAPLQFLLLLFAGRVNRRQQAVIGEQRVRKKAEGRLELETGDGGVQVAGTYTGTTVWGYIEGPNAPTGAL